MVKFVMPWLGLLLFGFNRPALKKRGNLDWGWKVKQQVSGAPQCRGRN